MGCRVVLAGLIAAVLLCPVAGAQLLPPVAGPVAELDRSTVSAAGRDSAIVTVRRFGRYAITVSSEQGVALQLVDRLAGPGQVVGVPGERDGRLDVFLDFGEYKIITLGHEKASGEAELEVEPFVEVNPEPAPQLVELKPVAESLGDLEQRSYWLHLDHRRWVHLEAAGRHLQALRLWRYGSWLEEASPQVEATEPVPGRPLLACRMAAQLEPGLYLVTAYGGVSQPWSDDNGETPFHLRFGVPRLGTAGRARHEVSPFGVDRYLVPAAASFYRMELPEAAPAELSVAEYAGGRVFRPGGRTASIDKESREPTAEITTPSGSDLELVTVRAAAGQPYILQHFKQVEVYRFDGSGSYWISTIHSGHPGDSIEATSFIAHWDRSGRLQRAPLAEQTVHVDRSQGWAARCNLLETLTIFVKVEAAGEYTIESEGVEARFRIEPFFVYRPDDYQEPRPKAAGETWDLNAGYYVLTVLPEMNGILDVALKPTSLLGNLLDAVGLGSEVEKEPVRAANRFESLHLEYRHRYALFRNLQPGVQVGAIVRQLPMHLEDPLPLALRPGERVTVRFTVDESSRIESVSEQGQPLPLAVDGGEWSPSATVTPGEHSLLIGNDTSEVVLCSLGATPTRLLQAAPLPPVPDTVLDQIPDFEVLTEHRPFFFDLSRQQASTFVVTADEDALYRLESTGLLDTRGTLRSRIVTSLASAASGGSGRNFLLHRYLLSGDYQVTVRTQGSSAGHLGLELTRTEPIDGGQLREGLPARVALGPAESVVYTFEIDEPGRYRIRSLGLGGEPMCRLEDGEGWPIVAPGVRADLTRTLEAGSYRFVVLPEAVAVRRVTLLERLREPLVRSGHGPHQLPLDSVVEHRWMEPESDGAERVQDAWTFELAGATEVGIRLSAQMQGWLIRTGPGDPDDVAFIPPSPGWTGELAAGSYRLAVECSRVSNRVDYELEVRPRALLPGLSRELQVPVRVPVAVAEAGLVEITSLGSADVSARLFDAGGRLLASSDDRPADWNFHLARRLEPGTYELRVEPVAASSARTTVRVEARPEEHHPALNLPVAETIEPGEAVHIFPLETADGELLVASASSTETVGLAVERATADSWQTVGQQVAAAAQVAVPLAGGRHRLRVWSVDRQGAASTLGAVMVRPPGLDEKDLRRGRDVAAVAGVEPAVAVARLDAAAGTFRLAPGSAASRWSAAAGQALETARGNVLQLPAGAGWIALPAPGGSARLQAHRMVVEPRGTALQLPIGHGRPAVLDLDESRGPVVLALARSMLGQPAVEATTALQEGPHMQAVGITSGAAASVAVGGASVLRAWLASPMAEAVDVRVQAMTFDHLDHGSAGWGRTWGNVPSGGLELALPDGAKHCTLALSPGLVAAAVIRGGVTSVHFADQEALAEQLVTGADRLLLLPTGERPASYSVELLEAAAVPVLDPETTLERHLAQAGSLRLRLEAGAGRRLGTAGAVTAATFIGDGGEVARGEGMVVPEDTGTLVLEHGPGMVVAWLGRQHDPLSGLWQGVKLPRSRRLEPPASVPLEGTAAAFGVHTSEPVLLELRVGEPVVLRLRTAGADRTWIDARGQGSQQLLAAGDTEIAVRALGGGRLHSTLEAVTTPVTSLGEGPGPEVLLAPGEGRAFRFEVIMAATVGMGVRSEAGALECSLLTASGTKLGEGVVQQHELEPGEYVLLVRLPADTAASRVRPAVVGLERPPTGPPEETIRSYLEMERSSS